MIAVGFLRVAIAATCNDRNEPPAILVRFHKEVFRLA
jgi:hypothetical protein